MNVDEELEGFGERARVARERLGLDQRAVADLVGTDVGSVSRWERGRGYPQAPQLARLARALGESLDYLVLGAASGKGPVEMPPAFLEFLQTEYGRIAQQKALIPALLAVRFNGGTPSVAFYKAIVLALEMDK